MKKCDMWRHLSFAAAVVAILLFLVAILNCGQGLADGSEITAPEVDDHVHVVVNRSTNPVTLIGSADEFTLDPGQWVDAALFVNYMYIDEFILIDGIRCVTFTDDGTAFPDG